MDGRMECLMGGWKDECQGGLMVGWMGGRME